MSETTGELSGVTIKGEDGLGKTALTSLPLAGGAIKSFDSIMGAAEDGSLSAGEVAGIAGEGTGFVQSCMSAASGIATDPIGWLVGQGLDFLLAVCQPLQDAIHFVSGDGPALSTAAENFGSIGTGLQNLGQQFTEDLKDSLKNWGGEASEAAGTKLADFAKGIGGVAGQAGDIGQLLQISSMIMSVIEDFIKALLTEFITWLIMIWIPALAAAVPSCGASTAAAGTATAVRGASTGARATRQVSKLQRLLDRIKDLLAKFKTWMGDLKTNFRAAMDNRALQTNLATREVADGSTGLGARLNAESGMVGERVASGFGTSMRDTAINTGREQVGLGPNGEIKPSKPLGHLSNADKSEGYDDIGEEQSRQETEDYLDI
jgi:uncharacterized protein YukE